MKIIINRVLAFPEISRTPHKEDMGGMGIKKLPIFEIGNSKKVKHFFFINKG